MGKFEMQLPKELLKEIEYVEKNSKEIFGEMTKAGAEVVLANVKSNMPSSLSNSDFIRCVGITRIYETPSDGGINTKVGVWGYFTDKDGRTKPAPLVANVFEYGSVKFPKQPFFRKSFRNSQIEKAMLAAQKRLSGGILDE